MADTGETQDEREIDTGGGLYNAGRIDTGGDLAGRDLYKIDAHGGAVYLGGLPAPSRAELPPLPERGSLPEPGPLPPGSRLPHPRNHAFTGREDDLRALADGLFYGAGGALVVTAVSRAGGIGKSELAVELCYRYGAYLGGVHWVSCAEPGGIAAEVAACGLALGLQPWPDTTAEQVALTLRAWQADPRRLVVLDNLEDETALRAWLARMDGLPVLATTRRAVWPPDLGLKLHKLDVLERVESLALLRRLAPRLEKAPEEELDALAERLGDLPLALDLAGRYLEECAGLSAGDFLRSLAEEGLLHPALQDWTKSSPTAHLASLARTFELSYDRLGADDDAAQQIFWAAGYCAPNRPIPLEVLRGAVLEERVEQNDFDRGLRRLVELGLLSPGEDGPAIHPLLAEFAQLMGKDEMLGQFAGKMESSSNKDDRRSDLERVGSREYRDLLTRKAETSIVQRVGILLKKISDYLFVVDEFSRLAGSDDAFGRLADALSEESGRALDSGLPERFVNLRAHMESAAAWAEENRLERAGVLLNNLACHLQEVAEYTQAKDLFERALHIDEQIFGLDHPTVAVRANNLGNVLQDLGDLVGARENISRALRTAERVYGPWHPLVATRTSNLGNVLHDLGDFIGARALYRRALAIDEQIYGPDDPKVAVRVNNLGLVLRDMGDLAGAREQIERALRIDERVYGAEHPTVATRAYNLGSVLFSLGDLAGAREQIARALAIRVKFLPEGHAHIRAARRSLEVVEEALGRTDNGQRELA